MSNDEWAREHRRRREKAASPKHRDQPTSAVRHSSFGFLSSFVIGHSSLFLRRRLLARRAETDKLLRALRVKFGDAARELHVGRTIRAAADDGEFSLPCVRPFADVAGHADRA